MTVIFATGFLLHDIALAFFVWPNHNKVMESRIIALQIMMIFFLEDQNTGLAGRHGPILA